VKAPKETGGIFMKMLRKTSCFLVVLLMVFSLIACTTNVTTPGTTVEPTATVTIAKGPVTLVWYHGGNKQTDEQLVFDEFNRMLIEKINARVDFRIYDFASYTEKMNMVIAANESFDICFTTGTWLNKFHPNVAKGAFYELDELIEKNAPELLTALPEFLLEYAKVDGKLYAIPNYQGLIRQWGICAPKDLLDKYSFDLTSVKKLQDLEPFLENIKTNEPGLFAYRPVYDLMSNKYEIGFATNLLVAKIDDPEMKVLNKYETQEFAEYANLMYEWFKKGYIRADIASVTNDIPDWDNQKYAVGGSNIIPGLEATYKAKFNRDWVFQPLDEPLLWHGAGLGTANAISKTSENPDKAIKLLEIMNTDIEMYNLKCFGIEGKHYQKISDNQIQPVEKSKYTPNTSWMFGNQFNAYFLPGQETGLWSETDKLNKMAKKSPLTGFVFDMESVKTEVSNVTAVEQEYLLLVKGGLDPAKAIPELNDKLKAAGIQKIIDEAQKQINAFSGK
jgi:putative aldouronate transport system substrate-binding protein